MYLISKINSCIKFINYQILNHYLSDDTTQIIMSFWQVTSIFLMWPEILGWACQFTRKCTVFMLEFKRYFRKIILKCIYSYPFTLCSTQLSLPKTRNRYTITRIYPAESRDTSPLIALPASSLRLKETKQQKNINDKIIMLTSDFLFFLKDRMEVLL